MVVAGDFKNGMTVEIEGNICQIVEFQHVKPGCIVIFTGSDDSRSSCTALWTNES